MLQVKLFSFTIVLIGLFCCSNSKSASNHEGKTWALLVAGSNEYYNYRHQADVCHSYHVVKEHGIPDENIIVMMYDDIANNSENPTPGVILNQPHGKNVYEGVPKDYTGEAVTPENFLHVLKGDSEKMKGVGSGRVINSTEEDHIFVFYSDHGGPGILGMIEEELHASDLHDTLSEMSSSNKFAKMVLLIEACHAGSMFDDILEDNTNILVLAAADPFESSYACCYSDKYDAYLGDAFSVNWMSLLETKDVTPSSSVHQFFAKLRTETEDSHVEEYGDLDMGSEELSEFIGHENASESKQFHRGQFAFRGPVNDGPVNNGPVNNGPVNNGPVRNGPVNILVPGETNRRQLIYPRLGRKKREVSQLNNLLTVPEIEDTADSVQYNDYSHPFDHGPLHHGPLHHDKSCHKETVPSLEVPLMLLEKKRHRSKTEEEKQMYTEQIKNIFQKRKLVDQTISQIMKNVAMDGDNNRINELTHTSYKINKDNMYCAKAITKAFSENCFKISKNSYVRGVLFNLIKTCNVSWLTSGKVTQEIADVCAEIPKYDRIV